jgi:hypothetical protein
MVNTARTETTLDDLESFAPAQDEITYWDSDVLVDDLAVAFRRVVIPKNLHGPDNLHTGGIRRYKDNTLLLICTLVSWVTLSEHQMNFATRVPSTRDPPIYSEHKSALFELD